MGIYYFAGAIVLLLLGLYLHDKYGGNNDKDKW